MPLLRVFCDEFEDEFSVPEGTILRDALISNSVDIYSPCGGMGTCGKCKVLLTGEGYVLSCSYIITKDINVVIPGKREAEILVAQHNYMQDLPFNPESSALLSSRPLGVAIDLGTTTIVFYLIDLIRGSQLKVISILNPQVKFGADVISRINYCAHKPDRLTELQKVLIDSINEQLDSFIRFSGGSSRNDIIRMTVAGNTTMMHLFLGIDPLGIALAPFIPAFTEKKILKARDLELHTNPDAEILLLPSLSAYIGADVISGIASINPLSSWKNFLFIDIGTNGEMALLTPDKIYCCAAAAGPAFEGANISCGMGAFEGAVSEFEEGAYKTIAGAKPVGICGSGLIDIIAFLLDKEYISQEGYMETNYVVVPGSETFDDKPLMITPADIREIQLAKSAIISGINILLKKANCKLEEIDCVLLAGGFGNYIKILSAVRIGLLPLELKNKTFTVGNTSGAGSVLALKSKEFCGIVNRILSITEYIELSFNDEFPEEFAMNMFFKPAGLF